MLEWTQTCHLFSEHLRVRETPKLKSIVLDGSLWESHWSSYIQTTSGSGGSQGHVDTSPKRLAEIRAAKRVAASAHSEWDNYYTHTPTKRAWNYKGTGSKTGGGKGKSWTANGKGEKKKRRRFGKGNK